MTENIDELIAQSQSIRDDMLKTIGKLEAFSIALTAAADSLRMEVRPNAGDCETGTSETDTPS